MTHFEPVSLSNPGPSFSDKGKARDLLYGNAPPPWYPATTDPDDEDAKLEGYWWGAAMKDDAYIAGLPSVPSMVEGPASKRRRIARRRSPSPQQINGNGRHNDVSETQPPALVPSKPLSMERVVHRAIDKLTDARKTMHTIQELQRYYEGDGTDPEPQPLESLESVRAGLAQQDRELKRKRAEARTEANARRKAGGEVGGTEAALELKRSTASLLAHAGFDGMWRGATPRRRSRAHLTETKLTAGANDISLDILTRVAGDYIRNLGRTFRLLLDGFAHQMKPEVSSTWCGLADLRNLFFTSCMRTASTSCRISSRISRTT